MSLPLNVFLVLLGGGHAVQLLLVAVGVFEFDDNLVAVEGEPPRLHLAVAEDAPLDLELMVTATALPSPCSFPGCQSSRKRIGSGPWR